MLRKRVASKAISLLLLAAGGVCAAGPVLSDLGQGIADYNNRNFSSAISHLRAAGNITPLSDYLAYYLAYSQVLTGDVDGALTVLNAYRSNPIGASPLAGKISLLYSRTLLDKRSPETAAKALNVLQTDYKALPQPDGDFALALAYEAVAEQQQAALSYERVFYSFPNTDLAAQSWTAMERLRIALGKDFPLAPPRQQLDRCEKWLGAKEYYKARQEYAVLADTLTGPEKDDARVGIAAADYLAGDAHSAFKYLKGLHVSRSEADAERLYYLTEASRSVGDDSEMMDAVKHLEEHYPKSVWRLKALITAGNRYLITNDRAKYTPLYKAASDVFPADSATAYSHWKVAWDAYLGDKPDRIALLREQVDRYPDDSRAGTALYFLGRIAESAGKYSEARAFYERLSAEFPHYFYAVLARQRMQEKTLATAPDPDVANPLAGIAWPAHHDFSATEPNAATAQRIERARLLIQAGLADVAAAEIRYGAKVEGEQPHILAMELAKSADSPFRALRIMKSFSLEYLSLPTENASPKFWQMLFPLPYKDELFVNARARGLDPYYVAALIRQESEFNPGAKSPANAYGLMQLLPSTGRMVAHQQGMGSVSTSLLLQPDVSLRLGTQYLRQQLDNWDGDWFRTLAAYNAGPGRVHEWLGWSNFREPAEFVESIPFTETREYVQAVLRNADMYRELYSGKPATGSEEGEKSAAVTLTRLVPNAPVNRAASATRGKAPVASRRGVTAPHATSSKRVIAAKRAPHTKKHEPA